MPGPIAQGYGPNAFTTKTSGFEYVIASQTHGRDSYHFLDARFAGGSTDDAQAALLAGQPVGSVSGYRYSGSYDELALTRKFGSGALSAKATLTHTSTTGFVDATATSSTNAVDAGQETLGLEYESTHGQHGYGLALDTVHRLGLFAGTALEARAHLQTVIGSTSVRLAAMHTQAQTQDAYSATAYDLSPPSAASITCDQPSATISAPSHVASGHPQADTISANVRRSFKTGVQLSAGGFLSSGRDMLVFPTSQLTFALDPGYLAELQRTYAALCPGQRLPSSNIFMQRYESVTRLTGREWFLDVAVPLGAWRAELTYETYSLFAPSLPADLAGVTTSLVPHAQLDGVPLHRANLLLSYRRRQTVAALALQYTSSNNAQNLPGHITAAIGVQVPLGPGMLAASAQNLLHAYNGTFVSSRYAVPLATNGQPIPTLATPLRPGWTLRYTLPVGPASSNKP
jgi:hypothetical protein